MAQVKAHVDGPVLAALRPGEWVVLGRDPAARVDLDPPGGGGAPVVGELILGPDLGLSRAAVWLFADHAGGVRVVSHQSSRGVVLVDRVRGGEEARLREGAEHRLVAGTFVLRVVNGRTVAEFVVATGGPERPAGDTARGPGATVGKWRAEDVLNAGPRTEWQTVAALSVLAYGGTRANPLGAQRRLKELAGVWFGGRPSDGYITNRLDQAISGLGLVVPAGSDKVPAIAAWMLRVDVLDASVYADLRTELDRRKNDRAGSR